MKPLCKFIVLLPLAALCFFGALLLLIGERQDSRALMVAGLLLSAPFALWAALFLSFFLVVMIVASAMLLSGRILRGVGRRSSHQ
jgi:hypothetical protein